MLTIGCPDGQIIDLYIDGKKLGDIQVNRKVFKVAVTFNFPKEIRIERRGRVVKPECK